MDTPMTEQDVKALETLATIMVPLTKCDIGIASRARALLAHRDLMIKERDDAVLKAQHAVNAEMKANEELTKIRHALGGFAGPTYGIAERVKKVVADRDLYAEQASEADDTIKRVKAERDTLAARVKELEGIASDRCHAAPEYASKPPEGHMIQIPAEYSRNMKAMHAYADGYLAGKDSK